MITEREPRRWPTFIRHILHDINASGGGGELNLVMFQDFIKCNGAGMLYFCLPSWKGSSVSKPKGFFLWIWDSLLDLYSWNTTSYSKISLKTKRLSLALVITLSTPWNVTSSRLCSDSEVMEVNGGQRGDISHHRKPLPYSPPQTHPDTKEVLYRKTF